MKLNAALEVVRIKKNVAVLLYFMNWKLALPTAKTKIDRPAKHDLQLCEPVCQATFTLNDATAADIPACQHMLPVCLHGLRIGGLLRSVNSETQPLIWYMWYDALKQKEFSAFNFKQAIRLCNIRTKQRGPAASLSDGSTASHS